MVLMPKKSVCFQNHQKGFTLVELLVVITIIAVLSTIGIVMYTTVQRNARDAKRIGDMQAISKALEMYKSVNGSYPTTSAISIASNWDTFAAALSPYMQSLPKDPTNSDNWTTGKFYKYHTNDTGTFYQVAASLEMVSQSTDNFTYKCDLCSVGNCMDEAYAHQSVPECTFDKARGGFGYDSQQ